MVEQCFAVISSLVRGTYECQAPAKYRWPHDGCVLDWMFVVLSAISWDSKVNMAMNRQGKKVSDCMDRLPLHCPVVRYQMCKTGCDVFGHVWF